MTETELTRVTKGDDPSAAATDTVRPTTTPSTPPKRPIRTATLRTGHFVLLGILGWGASVGVVALYLLGRPSTGKEPRSASGLFAASHGGDPVPRVTGYVIDETEIRTGPGDAYAKPFAGATSIALAKGQPVEVLAEEEDPEARGNAYLLVEFKGHWAKCRRMRAYVPRAAVLCGGAPCVAPKPRHAPRARRYVGKTPLLVWPDPGFSCDVGAYGSLHPGAPLTVLAVEGNWALVEYRVSGSPEMLDTNNGRQKRAYIPYDDAAYAPLPP